MPYLPTVDVRAVRQSQRDLAVSQVPGDIHWFRDVRLLRTALRDVNVGIYPYPVNQSDATH
jgi:hypothetical protein